MAKHYVIGLQWVLKYYYQGVPSWGWYFPYHYAPFASDFNNIADAKCDFSEASQPFNPFDQLMAVFPAASMQHVPRPWQRLMYEISSPIIDFYPEDFQVDLNGESAVVFQILFLYFRYFAFFIWFFYFFFSNFSILIFTFLNNLF